MQNKGSFLRSALTLIVLFLVFALLLTGLNVWAGPRIELSRSFPGARAAHGYFPPARRGFTLLYSSDGSAGSELTDVPETVQSIYTETSGLGYAILLSTTQGYTHDPIEISMAVDTEGKIVGTQVLSYPDTKGHGCGCVPADLYRTGFHSRT